MKNCRRNSTKKCQPRIFEQKNLFQKGFLLLIFFYLILELNPNLQLFFQLSNYTGKSTNNDFPDFQKMLFWLFRSFHLSWDVIFDKKTLTFTAQLQHALCWKKNLPPSHLLNRQKSEPFRIPIFRPANPISFILLLCVIQSYCCVVITS